MPEDTSHPSPRFGQTAGTLSRNPLGIIALFLVLVYGFAAMVISFGGSLQPSERAILVYFLVFFPVLVLVAFTWLVARHSGKLFAPGDFRNEDNYVKMQLAAVASLTAATAKGNAIATGSELQGIVELVQNAVPRSASTAHNWRNRVLWVDDHPENNVYERGAFEAIGLRFTLSLSTEDALEHARDNKYAVIISDMGRKEGAQEGYRLLESLRSSGNQTPLIFYAGSSSPDQRQQAARRGAQGCTNNAQELFRLVTSAAICNSGT